MYDVDLHALSQSPLPDAAHAYARAGLHIFPLTPGSKAPLPIRDEHNRGGFYLATTNITTIGEWWSEYPDANIAMQPGRSGILLIDIDGEKGHESWGNLPFALDVANTLKVISPGRGGGMHLWFEYPADRTITKALIAPGVEVFGMHGYVLLPPSIHPVGDPYHFHSPALPLPAPDALLEMIPESDLAGTAPSVDAKRADEMIAALSVTPTGVPGMQVLRHTQQKLKQALPGERHEIMLRGLGQLLRMGFINVSDTLKTLESEWVTLYANEGGNLDEFNRMVLFVLGQMAKDAEEDGYAEIGAANEVGAANGAANPEPPRSHGTSFDEHPITQVTPPQRGSRLVYASQTQTTKLKWLIQDLVPFASPTLLYGPGGKGKSMWALWLAERITSGTTDGELKGEPGGVIYMSTEDLWGATIVPRAEAAGVDREKFAYIEVEEGEVWTLPHALVEMEQDLKAFGQDTGVPVRLIVLDPLNGFIPGVDANTDAEVRSFVMGPLTHFCEKHGVTVLSIGHVNKRERAGAANRSMGSVGFINSSRSALAFSDHPHLRGTQSGKDLRALALAKTNLTKAAVGYVYRVERTTLKSEDKGLDMEVPYLELVQADPTITAELVLSEAGPQKMSEKDRARAIVLGQIEDHGGWVIRGDVNDEAAAQGIAERTVQRAISEMRETNEVALDSLGDHGGAGKLKGKVWVLRRPTVPLESIREVLEGTVPAIDGEYGEDTDLANSPGALFYGEYGGFEDKKVNKQRPLTVPAIDLASTEPPNASNSPYSPSAGNTRGANRLRGLLDPKRASDPLMQDALPDEIEMCWTGTHVSRPDENGFYVCHDREET